MLNPDRQELATLFIDALSRQVQCKAQMRDGLQATFSPERWLLSITEEAGEVASALLRERTASAVAECIDVAHSALLLAICLDPTGDLIKANFMEHK